MNEKAERRKIALGITGSIAAYKSAELARIYISRGYEVKVVMTDSAKKFITPLLMQSITGNTVYDSFWDDGDNIEHIEIADWADVLVIAPATADFLAKLNYGFADTPLLATALATKSPILIAPAMNVNMYEHPKTQEHMVELKKKGVHFVDAEEGSLACGWIGAGRLADPWEIFYHTRRALSIKDFAGKKILVTTGPTREALDPVRFISNRSSGKMGVSIVREAFCRGAEVTLIHGPCEINVPKPVTRIAVETAQEMYEAVMKETFDSPNKPDIVIMAAAVADFKPSSVAEKKIKKGETVANLTLAKNPDILSAVGEKRGSSNTPLLVGFAVETGELEDLLLEIRRKLQTKKADMIVGNFAQDAFDLDTNRVWLIDRHGRQEEVATNFKSRVADKILNTITRL
ncbi:MAG: bifunctional phosphopantothenoylcysteine decarboxylase/phosphopantothenate--cysteine ligase CoaBC [SAR324 cluster bacterium]|uniref:Coenzyme A biosynthesis bifunctional protein CoaBC n=1 Tax=SAR324 cluster bacterium TaxID=2024889 RepID=A0A7X9FTD7_9DELT|nr:bifunctional phosphopantothenoylcysteine decarboxylase/phosphopantothenate--cysteine ligase CoaBC [SAR324 cluster bacterium]